MNFTLYQYPDRWYAVRADWSTEAPTKKEVMQQCRDYVARVTRRPYIETTITFYEGGKQE